MISKQGLLACSVTNFTKFGSKRFTLDELAKTLGISKKTIYKHFRSKEDLVIQSVQYLVEDFKREMAGYLASETDPIHKIVLIYQKGFEYLHYFQPSFIFGLKKYYPKANEVFDALRFSVANVVVFKLLEEAKNQQLIREEVNIALFCELYFRRLEEIAFKNNNLFEAYSQKELLDHFIIFNLRGITTTHYKNALINESPKSHR